MPIVEFDGTQVAAHSRRIEMFKHISIVAVFVALVLSLTSAHALNPFSLNYTYELYSSADGSVQFIMLFTADPVRAGQTLVASNGSAEHVFVIPSSFPGSTPPITLIGTQSFADLKLVAPDFVVPDGFLFLANGLIRFGPTQANYSALPSDDVTAFWVANSSEDHFEWSAVAVATNSAGAHLTFGPGVAGVNALIEYHSSALDDYFLTALPSEIEALDSGTSPGWQRTGYSVVAWTSPIAAGQSPPADLTPVCRLYIPPIDGDSHFYSVSTAECASVPAQHAEVVFETDAAFFATLPNLQTGTCPADQTPVYRLWNPRGSSHRYTTQTSVRDEMLIRGYVAEGYGPDGVAMCVGGHK
jgi:uncharacterized protein DUF5648